MRRILEFVKIHCHKLKKAPTFSGFWNSWVFVSKPFLSTMPLPPHSQPLLISHHASFNLTTGLYLSYYCNSQLFQKICSCAFFDWVHWNVNCVCVFLDNLPKWMKDMANYNNFVSETMNFWTSCLLELLIRISDLSKFDRNSISKRLVRSPLEN